jgi:hypothetical protein
MRLCPRRRRAHGPSLLTTVPPPPLSGLENRRARRSRIGAAAVVAALEGTAVPSETHWSRWRIISSNDLAVMDSFRRFTVDDHAFFAPADVDQALPADWPASFTPAGTAPPRPGWRRLFG